jgi:hypothetical protein
MAQVCWDHEDRRCMLFGATSEHLDWFIRCLVSLYGPRVHELSIAVGLATA